MGIFIMWENNMFNEQNIPGSEMLDPRDALAQARAITKAIKYDDTTIDIISKITTLAKQTSGINTPTLELAIDDVLEAHRKLTSAVYSLEEAFEDAASSANNADEDIYESSKKFSTFLEYYQALNPPIDEETIVPPSGKTIGPSAPAPAPAPTAAPAPKPANQPSTTSQPSAEKQPGTAAPVWSGQGNIEKGMTVNLEIDGKSMPQKVVNVDTFKQSVEVEDPTKPGKTTVYNQRDIKPGQAGLEESQELLRLRQLAGINESASAGATGAGNIAVAMSETGSMIRRRTTTEQRWAKEYTPSGPAKTIVGDTKPGQASGELSANLAANKKPTASRTNNGRKK